MPTTTPLARRSPWACRSRLAKPSQRVLPCRSRVNARACSCAVPAGPAAPGACWAANAAVLPRLTDGACSVMRASPSATMRGASKARRRLRSRSMVPASVSVSLLRSDRSARPAACSIGALMRAWPRNASSAPASPPAAAAGLLNAGSAGSAPAAPAPASTRRRAGVPLAARAWPSPARVSRKLPPAAPGRSAAGARKLPASRAPPGWAVPPGSGLVLRVMSSVPALPCRASRPSANSVVAVPSSAPWAPAAVMRLPACHSSNGLRRLTLPASSTWPRSWPSVDGRRSSWPDTSMALLLPSDSTPNGSGRASLLKPVLASVT